MATPILSLDFWFIFIILLSPGAVTWNAEIVLRWCGVRESAYRHPLIASAPYYALFGLAAYQLNGCVLFCNRPLPAHYFTAVLAGIGCLCIEYAIGAIAIIAKYKKLPRGLSLHGQSGPGGLFMRLLVMLVFVVGEEIIYRQAFFAILLMHFKVPLAVVFAVSGAAYGLNHPFYPPRVILQKTVSGILYAWLYWTFNCSIVAVVIVHYSHNVTLTGIGALRKRHAAPVL